MAHQRKLIRQAVVALLAGAGTAAGARVKGTRVEPNKAALLPAISVYTLSESTTSDSDMTAPIELTRELKLEVAGWVAHTDAHPVDDAMDDLAEQIEAAMASNYYLTLASAITAIDHTTGNITLPAHGLSTAGSQIAIATGAGGVIPAGLSPLAEHWAIVVDANTIQLADSIAHALAGIAVAFTGNGTLPLNILVGTVVDQMLTDTVMQVLEDDGKSDPLLGIVALTYSITYRTNPATAGGLGDFVTADVKQELVGGVADTTIAEDTFTVEESP